MYLDEKAKAKRFEDAYKEIMVSYKSMEVIL